jgi:GNAT superfamily N-acetyltransferase
VTDIEEGPGRAHGIYPAELERDLVARDGERLQLRPIRPDDAPRLQALHGRLSRQTLYQRFFSIMKRLPTDWARYLADVDYHRRLALVIEREPASRSELIGVGRYEPTDDPAAAEVAFVLEDRWQNQGLGTALLHSLLGPPPRAGRPMPHRPGHFLMGTEWDGCLPGRTRRFQGHPTMAPRLQLRCGNRGHA